MWVITNLGGVLTIVRADDTISDGHPADDAKEIGLRAGLAHEFAQQAGRAIIAACRRDAALACGMAGVGQTHGRSLEACAPLPHLAKR
jgi:hypothetical protein